RRPAHRLLVFRLNQIFMGADQLVMPGLVPRLSGSPVSLGNLTVLRGSPPLTLPLRGSLPLPARGGRAGGRGPCRQGASNSVTVRGAMTGRTTGFSEPDSRGPVPGIHAPREANHKTQMTGTRPAMTGSRAAFAPQR